MQTMNHHPKLPMISIYKNKGVEIINNKTISYLIRASAYSLIQNKTDANIYSGDMKVYNLEQKSDKFKNTRWNRFLAKTIYNPMFDVSLNWSQIKGYKLDELKTKINECIVKDDDVLTQYVNADFFIHKINQASDFSDVIFILNKYYFEIEDEDLIWKENEEWNIGHY